MSNVYIANTIEEACAYLNQENCMPCAGATNLYVDRYLGKYLEKDMVSLHKLDCLKEISHQEDGWHIGSLCTFDQLESYFKEIPCLDALAHAASLVGGPQVRNRGTIGGNIVSASPSADTLPVLMALDARVVLVSENGNRTMPVESFMTGVKKTAIAKNELLTEVIIPDHEGKALFYKVGKRNALAIAICNLAIYAERKENQIKNLAIAIGSCAPTCLRAKTTEDAILSMTKPNDARQWQAMKNRINDTLSKDIHPIDDVRATASYRKKIAKNLICKMIKELWEEQ